MHMVTLLQWLDGHMYNQQKYTSVQLCNCMPAQQSSCIFVSLTFLYIIWIRSQFYDNHIFTWYKNTNLTDRSTTILFLPVVFMPVTLLQWLDGQMYAQPYKVQWRYGGTAGVYNIFLLPLHTSACMASQVQYNRVYHRQQSPLQVRHYYLSVLLPIMNGLGHLIRKDVTFKEGRGL